MFLVSCHSGRQHNTYPLDVGTGFSCAPAPSVFLVHILSTVSFSSHILFWHILFGISYLAYVNSHIVFLVSCHSGRRYDVSGTRFLFFIHTRVQTGNVFTIRAGVHGPNGKLLYHHTSTRVAMNKQTKRHPAVGFLDEITKKTTCFFSSSEDVRFDFVSPNSENKQLDLYRMPIIIVLCASTIQQSRLFSYFFCLFS